MSQGHHIRIHQSNIQNGQSNRMKSPAENFAKQVAAAG